MNRQNRQDVLYSVPSSMVCPDVAAGYALLSLIGNFQKVSDKLGSSQQTEYFEPQGKRPDMAGSQASKGCPGSETRSDIGSVSKSRISCTFENFW